MAPLLVSNDGGPYLALRGNDIRERWLLTILKVLLALHA
jgi:hypothetical protein